MTTISAIVTCYNVQEYIATTLQSIIDCNFDNLELIVVDDCSTDRTRIIIDAVAKMHPELNIIPIYFSHNTVGGVACAANAGLDVATGDLVIFIDGDDWVIPANLRDAVELQLTRNPDFTVCNCLEYWNDSGEYTEYPEAVYWEKLPTLKTIDEKRNTLLRMAPFPWRKIYKRSFLDQNNIRFPVGDFFFEDNPFHWSTSVCATSFEFYDKPTHVHRMARVGQTVNAKGNKYLKIFEHATIIRDQLAASGVYKSYELLYVDWVLRHIIWCGAFVPAGFLNEVFERARSHTSELSPDLFWHALAISGFEVSDVRKLAAIYLDERFEFLKEF